MHGLLDDIHYLQKEAAAKYNPTVTNLVVNFRNVLNTLLANGWPQVVAPLSAAQVIFETGNKLSNVAKTDNNYSGIMWTNKPYQKATKGLPFPASEGKYYYAHFASVNDWAKDFKRILSIKGPKGAPIDATSLGDYVARLYANKYFTSSPTLYVAGMSTILASNRATNDNETATVRDQQMVKKIEALPGSLKPLLYIGGGLLLLSLLRR